MHKYLDPNNFLEHLPMIVFRPKLDFSYSYQIFCSPIEEFEENEKGDAN